MQSEIRYLNTDLDLASDLNLSPLDAAFKARGMYSLHVTQNDDGRWYGTFEPNECFDHPEASMSVMLTAIESLEGKSLALWSTCDLREFNIGYSGGDHPWAFNNELSNNTILRIGAIGALLRITLYPPDPPYE